MLFMPTQEIWAFELEIRVNVERFDLLKLMYSNFIEWK